MNTFKHRIALLTLLLSAGASAQVISYDPGTSILTIPSVKVGGDTYLDVTLRNVGNYTFVLQGAAAQVPPGAAAASYDVATGLLTLPSVAVGYTTFVNVTLLNVGNYTFAVQSATEQPPYPPYPTYPPN